MRSLTRLKTLQDLAFWPQHLAPEWFVFVLGCVSCIALTLAIPPFMIPDGDAHFYRVYELSEGHMVSEPDPIGFGSGRYLPASMHDAAKKTYDMRFHPERKYSARELQEGLRQKLNPADTTFCGFSNTAMYTLFPYLPQAAGVLVARLFEAPPVAVLWFARLVNAVAVMGLLALAVHVAPAQKWTLATAALLPMVLFETASVAADGMTIAYAFLFISLIARAAIVDEQAMTGRYLVILGALAVALALSKSAYVPMIVLLIIIPASKFRRGWAGKMQATAAIAGVSLAAGALWAWRVHGLYINGIPGANPSGQLHFVLLHPLAFLRVTLGDLQENFGRYFWTLAGDNLGWLDVHIASRYLTTMMLGIGFLAVFGGRAQTSEGGRAAYLVTLVLTYLMLAFMLYLSWNSVGSTKIQGLGGRYFLPVLPLVLFALGSEAASQLRIARLVPYLGVCLGVASSVVTFVYIVERYYAV